MSNDISLQVSGFHASDLTFVAWINILISSSIRLGDCKTAIRSRSSYSISFEGCPKGTALTTPYSHSLGIVISDIILNPFPVYISLPLGLRISIESLSNGAISN
jgi:hypothetical protein